MVNLKRNYLTIFVLIIFLPNLSLSNDLHSIFTEEEIEYIKHSPAIKIPVETAWPPFNFIEYGEIKGYSNDYIRLISEKSGLKLNFIRGYSWDEMMDMLRNREIDIINNYSMHESRKKFSLYTEDPIITSEYGILVKKGDTTHINFTNLNELNVAVVKDFYIETVLREHYPEINLILTRSTSESVKQVTNGNAVAAIDRSAVLNYVLSKELISGVEVYKITNNKHFEPGPMYIGIRSDGNMLKSIIDKSISLITEEELKLLNIKWVEQKLSSTSIDINLTQKEVEYLENKGKLYYSIDPAWYPYESIQDGKHIGITRDILTVIEKQLNIEFILVMTESWKETLELAENRKIDFIPLIEDFHDRHDYLNFSRPYIRSSLAIVSNYRNFFTTNLNEITGKKIAYIEGYNLSTKLKNKYTNVNFIAYNSKELIFRDILNGKLFGYIDSLEVINKEINNYPSLKVSGFLEEELELSFATLKDDLILSIIFEKVLDSIGTNTIENIISNWNSRDNTIVKFPWRVFIILISSLILVSIWTLTLRVRIKQKTAELEKSEHKYKMLVENLDNMIYVLSPELIILAVNNQFENVLHQNRNVLKGMYFIDIFDTPENREYILKSVAPLFETKSVTKFQYKSIDPNAQEVHYWSVTLIPEVDQNNNIERILGSNTDITKLIIAQDEVERLHKAEKDNLKQLLSEQSEELHIMMKELIHKEKLASLGSLVAGVSHEINTPLGVAITAASFMDDETVKFFNAFKTDQITRQKFTDYMTEVSESIKIVNMNLSRAAEIIRCFKSISIDQNIEERAQFNLLEYINAILLSLKHEYKQHSHNIVVNCPENIVIDSYPGAFSQVITNLIMNSIKHGFREINGGEISITATLDNNELNLSVKDNGCGIPEERLSSIYDPFFTTERANGGSGLGLNIVHNIVLEQLHGTISCNSVVDEGTEFIISVSSQI